jgi:hypothetical protein
MWFDNLDSIRASFLARDPAFNCFSRVMAYSIVA